MKFRSADNCLVSSVRWFSVPLVMRQSAKYNQQKIYRTKMKHCKQSHDCFWLLIFLLKTNYLGIWNSNLHNCMRNMAYSSICIPCKAKASEIIRCSPHLFFLIHGISDTSIFYTATRFKIHICRQLSGFHGNLCTTASEGALQRKLVLCVPRHETQSAKYNQQKIYRTAKMKHC